MSSSCSCPRAGPDGTHSYGVINDYVQAAVKKARVVIAEVNDQVPRTNTDGRISPARIDYKIETSRPVIAAAFREKRKPDWKGE